MRLTEQRINELEQTLKTKRIGLIGDFCLDVYWEADMTRSELSRETPHFPLPVTKERVYPGAGGNVAANIAALVPGKISAMSLYGDDWRGLLLLDILAKTGIDTSLFIKTEGRFTNAYCKPMKKGISSVVYEDPRIDFDNTEPVSQETEEQIIKNLRILAENCDILCVADQFRYGIVTDAVRAEIIRLAAEGLPVIADSRYNIAAYTDCIIKPNEVECWKAVYGDDGYLSASTADFTATADKLAVKNRATVFCTLGDKGSYITNGADGIRTDAQKLTGEIDICGAGDTSISAFACALAAGAQLAEAAALAGLASSVTVKKIGVTGTASFEEIKSRIV